MDCVEIVRDEAVANAMPIVHVTNPQAQVTHEAAIGTVDKKELETLMSRGLDEEAAVDIIVRGYVGRMRVRTANRHASNVKSTMTF
jgi:Fe-S cluster assembly scaffold protein SufB